jgi:hypothetical protein
MGVGTDGASTKAPQRSQNLLPASTLAPQPEQTVATVAPQARQNRAPCRFSSRHREQIMREPPTAKPAGRGNRTIARRSGSNRLLTGRENVRCRDRREERIRMGRRTPLSQVDRKSRRGTPEGAPPPLDDARPSGERAPVPPRRRDSSRPGSAGTASTARCGADEGREVKFTA